MQIEQHIVYFIITSILSALICEIKMIMMIL